MKASKLENYLFPISFTLILFTSNSYWQSFCGIEITILKFITNAATNTVHKTLGKRRENKGVTIIQ